MSQFKIVLLIVVLMLVAILPRPVSPVAAQVGANCPAVVQAALDSIDDVCTGLGRNETCYGYNRVDALFRAASTDLVFNAPSDRVPLIDVQRLATAPLDVDRNEWGIAAMQIQSPNLPATLPGQAVMFLLMGDVSLENQVDPEDVALPVTPVEATTSDEVTLYTFPALEANRLNTIPEGTRVQAIGLTSDGDWVQILYNQQGTAWAEAADLETMDSETLAALPVTYGDDVPPRYGPMQAFYLQTGLAGPSCNEAPDALVVQSPGGMQVALEINDLQVEIGSTVAFTTVTMSDDSETRVLVGILFEGHMRIFINGEWIELTEPGQSFAITLNEDGLIDENSQLIQLGNDPLTEWLHSACSAASEVDLLSSEAFGTACNAEVTYYTTDEGFVNALNFPGNLPTLGETTPPNNPPANNPPVIIPPPPVSPPVSVQVPLQWPVITHPASGTTLVGGGSHTINWTSTPGATGYRLDVYPDSTNQVAGFMSFQTSGTSYELPLSSLPSRAAPGWGYFMRVVPLNGGGPMGSADQAPAIWVVRQDPAAPPPPPATEVPPQEQQTEEPREEPTAEVTEEPRDPGPNEPYCYEVCDEIEGCYIVCDGVDVAQ